MRLDWRAAMQSTGGMCLINGCGLKVKRRGLCYGHYMKQWRYGDPLYQQQRPHVDLVGQQFGLLHVREYVQGDRSNGSRWLCVCECGASTLVRTGDLNRGTVTTCGASAHTFEDTAEYSAAHERIRSAKGSASDYQCVDCGGAAAHWSYDHADPDERTSAVVKGNPAYSLDPDHYDPRCVSCHKVFDLDYLGIEMPA